MARLIVALIRHGDYHQLPETPSAHQPFPINTRGEAHAREAAQDVRDALERNNGWRLAASVDSSRLLRGWQTARIITDELAGLEPAGLELESFDALAERSVGSAANLTVEQIEAVIRQDPRFPDPPAGWKSDSRYRLPLQGAESLLEAGERVAAHLNSRMAELARVADNDTLKLCVGHGAAFRHAAFHLGVLEFEQLARLSMFHGRPVYLEYLSGGQWRHISGDWKVRTADSQALD